MFLGVRALLLSLVVSMPWVFPSPAPAANRNAADCSPPAVTSAIDSAVSGDTVLVPAGNCTWASPVTLPTTKDLSLFGAGAGSTVITCSALCLKIPTTVTTRVAGFTFTYTGGEGRNLVEVGYVNNAGSGKTFRMDRNTFTSVSAWGIVQIYGGGPNIGRHPTGLVDHNTFNGVAVHLDGSSFLRAEGSSQDLLWSQNTVLGDGTDVVYIEDNTFIGDRPNHVDGNYGARYVVRFNTMTGHATGTEVHSVQGDNRAVQRWEIYNNTMSKPGESFYPVAYIRAGTGVVFGNRVSSNFTFDLLLDNVRSLRDPGNGVGACDGSSSWDQNSDGQSGYACRDQIGRGRDDVLWTTGAPYTQPLQPAYFWDNIKGTSTPLSVLINADCGGEPGCLPFPGNNTLHLVENRDWYRENTSFDGTAGVGRGPLAARPATCTAGVAYWATDQGEWNSLQTGPDGQLYRCTATNTWTLSYRPYTYPHPLQTGSMVAPSAPTSLRVQ